MWTYLVPLNCTVKYGYNLKGEKERKAYLLLTFALWSENVLIFTLYKCPVGWYLLRPLTLEYMFLLKWSDVPALPYVICSHLSQPSLWIAHTKLWNLCYFNTGFWYSFQCFLIPHLALFYSPPHGFWSVCLSLFVIVELIFWMLILDEL